jgi:hypothetical protein
MSRGKLKIVTNWFPKNVSACWISFLLSSFKKRGNIIKLMPSVMFLALTACASSPMIGRMLPEGNYSSFTDGISGYHYIPFEKGIGELAYDWFINSEESTLTLNGHYQILPGKWGLVFPLKEITVTIDAYLLNEYYEIVEVGYIYHTLYEDEDFEKEIKIAKTFPYKQEYRYITFKLSYQGAYYQ